MPDALRAYKAKRNFARTPEPSDDGIASQGEGVFVIQKHWARRLHYDFRLELGGTMKSWAIPKGPSLDPKDKRMAIHVEDHPLSYNSFEGNIPAGQYGAGKVIIWDRGSWEPLGNPDRGYREGHMKFVLHGTKLQGHWALVRMKDDGAKKEAWLLIKENDDFARPAHEFSVVEAMPDSVSGHDGKAATEGKGAGKKDASGKGKKHKASHLPPKAVKARLPDFLKPQLATLVDEVPEDDQAWQYEIKFDGYRILARVEADSLRLYTRSGNDWSSKLPTLVKALVAMRLPQGWYDGEIVALDNNGIPDFQRLQNAFDRANTEAIVYYLFDLPFFRGHDLRALPLQARRKILQSLFTSKTPDAIRFSEAFVASGSDILENACRLGLEGIIGKRIDSMYSDRRSRNWIKLKCGQRQEFVIGGYTDPQGSRVGLGSLLLGVHDDDGSLQYAGNVGTGFDAASPMDLRKVLGSIGTARSPFAGATGRYRKVHWVKPKLLAEVSFAGWTNDGHIRQGVFHTLRDDKTPKKIRREKPMALHSTTHQVKKSSSGTASKVASQKVTHPDRIIDESSGITKIELIRYYATVAHLILPHLKGRPTSLLRAPDGTAGELFFQKHLGNTRMKGVLALPRKLDPEHPSLLAIESKQGLLSATQMNVVEFHTWNAIKTAIGKPDRMTFDLDPGAKTDWDDMRQAATLVRSLLEELELKALLKTSGGKGLHVVVPIRRQYDWDTVKDFTHALVDHLAATLPGQFSAKSGPKNRVGKIFVDYLRNGFGATTASAWSVRAREGLGVSVPIAWNELDNIKSSAQWNVGNVEERLELGNKPWKRSRAQGLARAMKIFDFRPPDKD